MNAGMGSGSAQASKTIVAVDIPDPDNFLMVLRVLRDNPDDHVAVILSPRPVSFAALPYGSEFDNLRAVFKKEEIPIKELLNRVTKHDREGWVKKLPKEYQPWFYVDEDFTNSHVREDANIYLRVSKLRLIAFLDYHNIKRNRYSLYADVELIHAETIVPGMHHALHKPDYTFDFSDTLKSKYDAAVVDAKQNLDEDDTMRSEKLRTKIRDLCEKYVKEKTKELRQGKRHVHEYGSLESLVAKYKGTDVKPRLFIGGPFTETLAIIERLGVENMGPIVAMAGASHGLSNIFANQFNFLVDEKSALNVLKMAEAKKLDLTLLPTECAKGTAYELWLPKEGEVDKRLNFNETAGAWSSQLCKLYDQWESRSSAVVLFDVLAAMSVSTDLYKGMGRKVKHFMDKTTIKFEKLSDEPAAKGPGLKMYWNEPKEGGTGVMVFDENQHMRNMRRDFLIELRWTLCGGERLSEAISEELDRLLGGR